jgi:hypothetical protein
MIIAYVFKNVFTYHSLSLFFSQGNSETPGSVKFKAKEKLYMLDRADEEMERICTDMQQVV